MLKRLQVRDFKSLRELDVDFGRLTVLVGANGCGKSSVLQAVDVLRDSVLGVTNGFNAELVSWSTGSTKPVPAIFAEVEDDSLNLAIDAVFTLANEQRPILSLDRKQSSIRRTPKEHPSDAIVKKMDREPDLDLIAHFQRIYLYQLDTRLMGAPSHSELENPALGMQGENLGAFLDALQGSRRERFEAIEADLRKFITGLHRVRLRRVRIPVTRNVFVGNNEVRQIDDRAVGHQVVLDFEFARNISAAQASEGTILLLGLLTIIGAEPGPPMTIMLDDLDRALHPKAQRQLVEHLHQLLDQRPELQIIATSHSPYLVEHLSYDEVLAMTQSPTDGRSLSAPLLNHPDAERWREEMTAGEFWSNVGEAWIRESKVG